MTQLRYQKLTYELQGIIFEVHRKLKVGWPEEVYHQGLIHLLQDKGISVCSKPQKAILHRGKTVRVFECDVIVQDLVILELKALFSTNFATGHQAQLIHYLKCWNKDLGLLVNFGLTRVKIKRLVWDEPELRMEETYDEIRSQMTDADREYLRQVRQCILAIGQKYGLGYPETMYRTIIAIEIMHDGLSCQADVEIPAIWDDRIFSHYGTDHLLVENKYLVNICSLLDYPSRYEFARTKTYINSLGLKFGLIVNFGKKQLQIYGVNAE